MASKGTWTNTPTGYAYWWLRCNTGGCQNIGGATGATYLLGAADVGSTVRVSVTASNAAGSASATSARTGTVSGPIVPPPPPTPPVNTAPPTISGSATEGSTLNTSTGTWTNTPTSYSYQWQRCNTGACQNIGTPTSTYLLDSSDVGSTVRVSVTAGNASGSGSATSAPTGPVASSGGSSGDPVVVAVGDIAQPPGCNPCEQSATASLTQTFSPASVFVLGDNQYDSGSDSEYMGSYDLTWGHDFNSIVHPVPGNHEYLTSGASGYFQYFGDHGVTTNAPAGYYSVNLGTWHILSLNSNCSDQKGCSDALTGGTTSAEMSWLQSDLAANPSACVLATWHHPLFSYGWTLGAPSVAPLWTALSNVHADVVLNGHDHLYERYAQQDPSGTASTTGIREFVVGTGGESLNGLYGSTLPATLQANDREYGVLVLTLHAASYDWKFVNTSGQIKDSGTTACHGSGTASASVATARVARSASVARLSGPQLSFDARPLAASLKSVRRMGLSVAVHASRAVDVTVTTWRRQGHALQRIASAYETESQISQPHSRIVLHIPTRGLQGTSAVTLVIRFAAVDGAEHHRTITRTVRLS